MRALAIAIPPTLPMAVPAAAAKPAMDSIRRHMGAAVAMEAQEEAKEDK